MKANRGFNLTVLVVSLSLVALIGSSARAKLVACVGDSETYGYGLPNREYNCYPAQLATMLRVFDRKWEVRNFGVTAACVLKKGSSPWLPYIRQGTFNEARTCNPDVVVIQLGGNDSVSSNWVYKADFLADFFELIDGFVQLSSQPDIYICFPPPAFPNPYGIDNNVIRDEIIPLIAQLPTYRDVQLIDEYTPLKDSRNLFQGDGVHLTVEGTRLVAQIGAATIIGMCGTPDFNGDGIVNLKDFSRLAQYWGQSESQFDILPPPNGDGIVNSKDLAGFVKYWLQEFGLLAHWMLDEVEGTVAHDSVGDKDGTLNGNPVWQAEPGKIAGAVQLDGVDDYVSTPFILNPAAGAFSVFAWVKGGAPGQVIISQTGGTGTGAMWLGTGPSDGALMSGLVSPGRFGSPLVSNAVITDGQWHHIGLVCDGSYRTLYVDEIEAAKDAQPQSQPISANGGLYFGVGKDRAVGSFWSGLIDDVRIYDRAVTP
jgi:lysophospholipase L1-like esterase